MGFKSKVAGWVVGRVVSDVLKNMRVDKPHRENVTKAVKEMIKPKKEPVLYGGIISVAVALGAAFGLNLTVEELSVTISTIITVVAFVTRKFVSPAEE